MWQFGMFPFHTIQDDSGMIILKLTRKNYKLAKKLKTCLIENSYLLDEPKSL